MTDFPVSLPARDIAPPATISPEAQAYLAAGAAVPVLARPAADDRAGWDAAIAGSATRFAEINAAILARTSARTAEERIGGVPCFVATPAGAVADDGRPVLLYAHGGAFVFGGGAFACARAAEAADRLGLRVVAPDYRMPPDHPFPAAPDDMVAVFAALAERHGSDRVVLMGSSAGGNLAAAAALMLRDRAQPLPAALVLLTPEVDLAEAGDSFRTNELLDVMLKRGLPECNALYAAGHDLAHPYLSPLHGDLAGLPPCFVQAGTRDLFLSNAVLFHRKLRRAGVRAELHVWEAMPHGGFGGDTPEDAEVWAEIARFVTATAG